MSGAGVTFETIISVEALQGLVTEDAGLLLLDCEFDLGDPDKGWAGYRDGHLPGARYVDLERDLSGLPTGRNGRHPLPPRDGFAAVMRRLGLTGGRQVVAYDGSGGLYAARLWWMLRWLGHAPVAVLDGGRQAWTMASLPLETGEPPRAPEGDFLAGSPLIGAPVNADDLVANVAEGTMQVIDARDAARFNGALHPLDAVPGHIPGATNRPFRDNLDAHGLLRAPGELAAAFQMALAGKQPTNAVLQCGSGVTACHNALAMEVAGLKGARLYPGSWSEWTSDPTHPIA